MAAKLKKFTEYTKIYSTDPKTFEQKIALISDNESKSGVFHYLHSSLSVFEKGMPMVIWGQFTVSPNGINENFFYNLKKIPNIKQLREDFNGAEFIPKLITSRKEVKKLKFPIIGIDDAGEQEFKTFGKFKKSERFFHSFQEKIVPQTRFEVIGFKKEPIHIQEKINGLDFDVDLSRFNYFSDIKKITENLSQKYGLDFYQVSLLEADGRVYVESMSNSVGLTPSQEVKMYEKAYESYFEVKLPNWFKRGLFEKHIKPYYRTRGFDAKLLKPKHAINFEPFI